MRVRVRVLFSQAGSVSGERASPAMTVNAVLESPPALGESQNPSFEESEPRATAYDWGVPSFTWTEAHRDGRPAPVQGSRRRHLSRLNVHSLRTQQEKNLSVGRKIGTSAICLGSRMCEVPAVAGHDRRGKRWPLRRRLAEFSPGPPCFTSSAQSSSRAWKRVSSRMGSRPVLHG